MLAVVGSAYVLFINETHDLSLNLERQEMEPGRYAVSDCLHSVTQAHCALVFIHFFLDGAHC